MIFIVDGSGSNQQQQRWPNFEDKCWLNGYGQTEKKALSQNRKLI